MASNAGKLFEQDFKKSMPPSVYYYKLRDGTASWNKDNGDDNVRFQMTNDYDCFMFSQPNIYTLELKSYKNTSYSLTSLRSNQAKGLEYASKFEGVIAGMVFNIREIDRTFFIQWSKLGPLLTVKDKKYKFLYQGNLRASIPNQWIIENGVEITQWLKVKHYSYDIRGFINHFDKF